MKFKELVNVSLEDIYWRLKVGKSTKRLTLFELRSEINKYIQNPVFFISTGRCGTKWFSDLFNHNKSLMVLHSPVPNLAIQGKIAYELENGENIASPEKRLIQEIFFAGREQYLRYSYKTNKRYIETNNYITFFAPALIELFPDAKFVHIYRHPGEFVRSGIRRNYYIDNKPDDLKRIISSKENWKNFSQLEKISWLWNETNQFIEKFKHEYSNNCTSFNFNNLSTESVTDLFEFLSIKISPSIISKSLTVKSNRQKRGNFPKYENWNDEQKLALRNICLDLSNKYDFSL